MWKSPGYSMLSGYQLLAFDEEKTATDVIAVALVKRDAESAIRAWDSHLHFGRIQNMSTGFSGFSDRVVVLSGFEGSNEIGVGGISSIQL
jgi:hypothetical protein